MNKIIKIFILFICFIVLPVFADTAPYYVKSIPTNAIGMYQTGKTLVLYSQPESNSNIVKKVEFKYTPDTMPDSMFAALLNNKQLGFLFVTDIDEDGWIQVIYDKKTGAKGWVQAEDKMQFLPWINFYNLYGRKYGLTILKDAPDDIKTLYAKSEENSQSVAKLNYVKQIKLTAIRGNWALVSVVDLDKNPKTGYIEWRGKDGRIYIFPKLSNFYKD